MPPVASKKRTLTKASGFKFHLETFPKRIDGQMRPTHTNAIGRQQAAGQALTGLVPRSPHDDPVQGGTRVNAFPHVPRAPGSGRLQLLPGVVFAVILSAATAAVPGTAKAATSVCSNQTGTNGGYYYQMWSAGTGSACITLNSGNSYSTSWSGIGDFVAGVGWNPGSNHTVSFSGSLSASGGTTLVSLYGWSTSPLVE